jgi:hypothetical protein
MSDEYEIQETLCLCRTEREKTSARIIVVVLGPGKTLWQEAKQKV